MEDVTRLPTDAAVTQTPGSGIAWGRFAPGTVFAGW